VSGLITIAIGSLNVGEILVEEFDVEDLTGMEGGDDLLVRRVTTAREFLRGATRTAVQGSGNALKVLYGGVGVERMTTCRREAHGSVGGDGGEEGGEEGDSGELHFLEFSFEGRWFTCEERIREREFGGS